MATISCKNAASDSEGGWGRTVEELVIDYAHVARAAFGIGNLASAVNANYLSIAGWFMVEIGRFPASAGTAPDVECSGREMHSIVSGVAGTVVAGGGVLAAIVLVNRNLPDHFAQAVQATAVRGIRLGVHSHEQ